MIGMVEPFPWVYILQVSTEGRNSQSMRESEPFSWVPCRFVPHNPRGVPCLQRVDDSCREMNFPGLHLIVLLMPGRTWPLKQIATPPPHPINCIRCLGQCSSLFLWIVYFKFFECIPKIWWATWENLAPLKPPSSPNQLKGPCHVASWLQR